MPQARHEAHPALPLHGFAHDFSRIPAHAQAQVRIQTKSLDVSYPTDADEKKADEVARKVVDGQSAEIHVAGGTVNRKGEGSVETTPAFQSKLESSKGGGQSLAESTRREMESSMGADFSRVKIHTGSEAHNLNESVHAKAFSYGQDVFFRQGEFNPGSKQGKELLAHELTHTVQQGEGDKIRRKINIEGTHAYAPNESSETLEGFKKTTVGALNEINKGTTGSDGPMFIKNLSDISTEIYNVAIVESTNYDADANKFTAEQTGDLPTGGTLRWNPNMGLILENFSTGEVSPTEKPLSDTVKAGTPSATAEPVKKNYGMSPIRVLLHELDHADRLNFLRPMIANLGNPTTKDKLQGLNDEQKEYLQKGIGSYAANGWDMNDQDTYKEIMNHIIRSYNSVAGEETRVMMGSETRSGKKMKEGIRTHYDTGITGVKKTKGIKSTEEGIATDTEKKLIEAENTRIKEGNALIEEERGR